jgi:Spy/CpxP family protein refolding chaperone
MRQFLGAGGEHGGKCGPGAFLQGLDLSDEQIDRIAEIKAQSFSKLAHAKIDIFELKKQVFKELGSATIDRNKINSIVQKIKEQKSQLADLMVGNMIALAETLTPEQRKKLRRNKIRHFLGLEEGPAEEED